MSLRILTLVGLVSVFLPGCRDEDTDTTAPATSLTSPMGGEMVSGVTTVTWTTTDTNPGTVEIRASADGGANFDIVVAQAVPDTGSFSWNTTLEVDGSDYRVQVIATDASGNTSSPSSSTSSFQIDNTAPTVTLTAPAGGEVWATIRSITWTTVDASPGTVDILLSSDSGVTFPAVIASGVPDTGTHAWDTTTVADATTYRIRVTATDAAGNTGVAVESAADFAVDNVIKVSGPARFSDENTNGLADAGDRLVVRFTGDVSVSGAADSDFTLPVTGNTLGTGATVAGGPGADEVTITLGTSPSLKSRQTFDSLDVSSNAPSGIDVSGAAPDIIENAVNGDDAVPSTPADVAPVFVDSLQALGSATTFSAALGDLDADGDQDLVAGNDGPNEVWENNGAAAFASAGPLGNATTSRVTLGDFDRDGDLDIAAGNQGANRVWRNDGGLVFTDSGQLLGTGATSDLAAGDVDGDGDLDLVAGNLGEANRVWLGDGAGNFSDSGQTLGAGATLAVALGDVDGNGSLDLVEGNDGEPNRVWLGDGAGGFSDSGQSLGSGATSSLALGDLDGDGDLDIVEGNDGEPNRVWRNDGAGTFSDSGQALGSGRTESVALHDLDGDGDLDVVAGNRSPTRVFLNDGAGGFTGSGQEIGSATTGAVALGDLDGDGDTDLVEGNLDGEANRVWLQSLAGTWGAALFTGSGQSLGSNRTYGVALGDVDRDGDPDLVTGEGTDPTRVLLNNGSGTFTDSGQTLAGVDVRGVALADLDGDGDLDLVMANFDALNPGANQVWLNDGSGTFGDSGQTLGSSDTWWVAPGDLDRDGDIDLVSGNTTANLVWLNDGTGTFSDSLQTLGSSDTRHVALGDVDGDGDLDLVAGNLNANLVWRNDGAGSFTDSGQTLGSGDTWAVALGDLDRDGDLDMAVGNGAADLVWLNDGTGTFTDTGQSLASTDITFFASLGDLDGDGDLDLFAWNCCGQINRMWRNNGSGTFANSGQSIGAGSTWSGALADVDRDGDLDVVIGNDGADEVWLSE